VASDDELFDQVGVALQTRPGWRYEPSTTPGAHPSWCLDVDGQFLLSVTVIDGVHSVYFPNEDREIDFASQEALLAWVEENDGRFGGR
jgi:hypothetical protein